MKFLELAKKKNLLNFPIFFLLFFFLVKKRTENKQKML